MKKRKRLKTGYTTFTGHRLTEAEAHRYNAIAAELEQAEPFKPDAYTNALLNEAHRIISTRPTPAEIDLERYRKEQARKKRKPTPVNMFGDSAQDLPLFSGTAPRAAAPQPPQYQPAQRNLFTSAGACPACNGTGSVQTRKNKPPIKCTCEAGQTKRG